MLNVDFTMICSVHRLGHNFHSGCQLCSVQAAATPRQRNQNCPTIHAYFTQTEWRILQSQDYSWDSARNAITRRLDDLGLVFPSESTLLGIWCNVRQNQPLQIRGS